MSENRLEQFFSANYSNDDFNQLTKGLEDNLHFGFDFGSLSGEAEFASMLHKRLDGSGMMVFCLDLSMITSGWHFAQEYARAMVDGVQDKATKAAMIKRLASVAQLKLERNSKGELLFSVPARSELPRVISMIVDLPELSGMEENRRSVVIFSGFSNLAKLLGEDGSNTFFVKGARQAITSYILIGSSIEASSARLSGKLGDQINYKSAEELFPQQKMQQFLAENFSPAGSPLADEPLELCFSLTDGRAELLMPLLSGIEAVAQWEPPNKAEVLKAVDMQLEFSSKAYSALWCVLNGSQRSLLYGLSQGEQKGLYSEYFINRYGFGTATNLQASLRGLTSKGIIIKVGKQWKWGDPFFRLWIRRSTGLPLEG